MGKVLHYYVFPNFQLRLLLSLCKYGGRYVLGISPTWSEIFHWECDFFHCKTTAVVVRHRPVLLPLASMHPLLDSMWAGSLPEGPKSLMPIHLIMWGAVHFLLPSSKTELDLGGISPNMGLNRTRKNRVKERAWRFIKYTWKLVPYSELKYRHLSTSMDRLHPFHRTL